MAKGIEKVVAKFCVQTALYWGNPQNDGYGGFVYDDPVEMLCRWEDKTEMNVGWVSTGHPGNIQLSKASVLLNDDVDLNGVFWLGSLDDYKTKYGEGTNPRTVVDAYVVRRFDKIPMVFKTDEFVRRAWLYEQGK